MSVITPDAEALDGLTAERWLLDLAGELWPLLERHQVDCRGRCSVCRAAPRWWWPWPKRIECTVRAELPASLRHLDRVALDIITGHHGEAVATVGGSS